MFYQLFFEQGQDSMFIIRASDGRIIKVNDAAVKTYGYSRDEMLIMCLQDLFDPATVNTIESIKGGTLNECTMETRHGRKDSSTFPVEVSIKSAATEEGILLLGTVRDMTERESALEKIKKAEERYRLNIENINDEDGNMVGVTGIMTDITEQKRTEEILSRELDISATLAVLSGKLLSPASIEDISGIVLDHAQRLTDSRYGYVGYIERDTGYLNCSTLTRSIWDECKIKDKSTIYNKFDDLGGWVVKNKEPILTNQPRQDPRSAGTPPGHIPIERLLSVPATCDGALLGIVSLANSSRDYDEQDLELVQRLAGLFAIAVQRKWSEDDLKQSEEKSRRAHQQLLDIIESLPDATFVIDRDKKVIAWNQSMEELTGTRKEDIIGKSDYAYAVPLYGKPRPIMIDLLFEEDKETELLYDYIRKEGNSYYAEAFLPYLYGGRGAYLWGKISRLFDRDGNEIGAIESIHDITERKQAEEKIRQSEALRRSIIESPQNIIIFSLDQNYRYISFNNAHCETMKNIWGADIEIGRGMLEYITYHEDREKARINFDRALSGEHFSQVEEYGDKELGRKFWEDIYGPIITESGEIIGVTVFCSDISERILAQENLRSTNQHLLDIIDFLPDATFVVDRDKKVVAWNRAIEEITGVRKEDILGKGDYAYAFPFYGKPRPTLIDLIFSEDRDTELKYEYFERKDNTIYAKGFIPLVFNGEGAYMWGKASPLFDKDGNIVGAIESFHDISGLKHLEEIVQLTGEELRLALEKMDERELIDRIIQTSPAGLVFLNGEREITYANTRAVHVLCLKKDDTTHRVYRTPGRLFTDYDGNTIPDEDTVFRRVMVTGQPVYDVLHAIEWPDGQRFFLSINGAPLFDRSGRIEGVVLSIEDVTERKIVEKRISTYQKQLRSLTAELSLIEERERRRIAEGIHDHIGQSLAVARLKLGALKKAASLDTILGNLDEIVALIEETIQNTRSLTFELSPPILYDLGFEAAVEWLGEQILEKNGIQFYFKSELQSESMDEGFRIILFTAVRELFFNIIKHAKAQKVFIFVEKLGEKVQVKVKDDGIGFDYGLYGPGSGKAGGFGLLSIHERLKHLGGSLDIVSKPGYGTSVTIEAPLKSRD